MRELPECLSWFAFLVLRFLNLLQEPDIGVGSVLDAALAPHVSLSFYPAKLSSFTRNDAIAFGTNFELYNSTMLLSGRIWEVFLRRERENYQILPTVV